MEYEIPPAHWLFQRLLQMSGVFVILNRLAKRSSPQDWVLIVLYAIVTYFVRLLAIFREHRFELHGCRDNHFLGLDVASAWMIS